MAGRISAKDNQLRHLSGVLSLGIAAQVSQIVVLRELLMVFHGNELSLGIILAAWMFWTGAGSRIGGFFASKGAGTNSISAVAVSLATMGILVATIIIIRILRGFFAIEAGAHFSVYDMALSCMILMAPAGLLFGVQFVLLAHLWRTSDITADTSAAEKAYIGEAFGNMIGGVLFSFLLVHVLNSLQAVMVAVALMLGATLVLLSKSAHGGRDGRAQTRKPFFIFLLLGYALLFLFTGPIDQWAHERQWALFSPEYRLVETRQSRYGNISAAIREGQYSFFQSGNLVFSVASTESASPALEEHEAVEFAHFSMVQHPNPKQVLLIGGGLGGTLREIVRHPVTQVDYIELDPVLTETARPYIHPQTADALADPRVSLIHTDGRRYVKQTKETYDMIIVDVPDPATAALNRYYTEEFFREARLRLNPGGVFVTGAMSAADMRGEAVANRNATIYHTMARVFPHVLPVGHRFIFFFASKEKDRISAEASILSARYSERGIESEGFSPRQFELLLEESRLRRVNWIIRNHGRSPEAHLGPPETGPLFPGSIAQQSAAEAHLPPVNDRFFINSDFKPIGYYYTLRFWDALSRGDRYDAFKWILHVRLWWVLPAMAGCIALTTVLKAAPPLRRMKADKRFAVFLAVFTTGLSTMALQVALIFSFQSLYGFVYEMVGLIIALFMGGLAIGTLASRRLVKKKANIDTLACIQLGIALFAAMTAFLLPRAGAMAFPGAVIAVVGALTFFSGVLNGADFPLSTACCQALVNNPERAAGTVYGVELFGACAGALAASVVIAPVLGIAAVCMLAAGANFTAFMALLVAGGRGGG